MLPFIVGFVAAVTDFRFAFHAIFVLSFVPEALLLFSPAFRGWIREGVDSDSGIFRSVTIGHYGALVLMRMFVLAASAQIFLAKEVPDIIYLLSFGGAIIIELGLVLIERYVKK